jgi:hypothetical protein
MIHYVLADNRLTTLNPNDRSARPVDVISITSKEIAKLLAEANEGISEPEVLAMMAAERELIKKLVLQGHSINSELFNIHFAIPGTYNDDERPKEAVIRVTPTKQLEEIAKQIPLQLVKTPTQLQIDRVHDVNSDTTNQFLSVGGAVKVFGVNVRVVGEEPGVCAEFISEEDPEAIYPVPTARMIENNPSELVFLVPQMVVGELVKLRITTQFSGNTKNPLNKPRSTTFDRVFTVKN